AFREMKDATREVSATDEFAFLGKDDFSARTQLPLFQRDDAVLETSLLEAFRGRNRTFDEVCDEAYPDPRFRPFVESDFHKALLALVRRGAVTKEAVTTKTERGLRGKDRIHFPR